MTVHEALAAVVFDMDGVLLDSEPFWHEAEQEAFAAVGLELRREDCLLTMGMRVDEVVGYWQARRPWDTVASPPGRIADRILDGVIERIRARGRPLPGVGTALDLIASFGCRRALASSSSDRVIRAVLETLGLEDAFEAAVSAEHEARGKPDPGVYLTACARLAVEPALTLAIEDSLAGLASATAAGMRCLMVPDGSLHGRPELLDADLVLPSLEHLDEAAWRLLSERREPRAVTKSAVASPARGRDA